MEHKWKTLSQIWQENNPNQVRIVHETWRDTDEYNILHGMDSKGNFICEPKEGSVFSRRDTGEFEWRLYTHNKPRSLKLVAWINKNVFIAGNYNFHSAVYALDGEIKDSENHIRAPWLDQEVLENSKVVHYSLIECNTPYTKLMTTDFKKVTCEHCLKLEKKE